MSEPYYYPNGYRKTEIPGDFYTNMAPYTYPGNFNPALRLIADAISDEREDAEFYNYLINTSPNQETKDIITGIRNDELRHIQMFRTIYYQLTGELLPDPTIETFTKPKSFGEGIKTAIEAETKAIDSYTDILFAMQNPVHYNLVTDIISDQIRHGILLNMLLTMYFHPQLAQTSF